MNLMEALGEERYNLYREKFANWEISEVIIDDERAFWEIKRPGSTYSKVSLYRDNETMMIYGDYGRYTFNNMTWQGTPANLRYDELGYQMEKLDLTTKDALRIFDEDLCEKEIREWLAMQIQREFNLSPEDAAEMSAMNEWIMAEEHYEDFFDEAEILCNFAFFAKGEKDFDKICERAEKEVLGIKIEPSVTESYAYVTVQDAFGPMVFAQEAIEACQRGETAFLAYCNDSDWAYGEEFKENGTGYKVSERFYVALVALEMLGEKLRERENTKETEDMERD